MLFCIQPAAEGRIRLAQSGRTGYNRKTPAPGQTAQAENGCKGEWCSRYEGRKGKQRYYLICERNWIYFILILVAGFWGSFTYLLRGNVFATRRPATSC